MINQKPTKEEQIEALIHHRAYDLVMKYAPSEEINDAEAYAEVFTVKRKEILDHLIQHYQLGDLIHMQRSNKDGFYAIPEKNGFRTYEQERMLKDNEQFISNEVDVWKQFVDYLLQTSGTGLDFD